VEEPTVIAVDWSGARGPAQRHGIWVAIVRDGDVVVTMGAGSIGQVPAQLAAA
jgi:UDP-N-acetylmuramate-alanine ligase